MIKMLYLMPITLLILFSLSCDKESAVTDGSGEAGPVEVSYGGDDTWYSETSYSDNLPVWVEIEKRLNLKINWEVLPGNQYNTAMKTRLAAAKDLPDIIKLPGTLEDAARYAKDGLLQSMNALIEKNGPDIRELWAENPQFKHWLTSPDGEVYWVSGYIYGMQNGNGLVIRNDWLRKLNLDIPETIDDWYTILKGFKENDLNDTGSNDIIPIGNGYQHFASGFGLVAPLHLEVGANDYWVDNNGKVYYQKTAPEYKEFLTFLNQLHNEELLDPFFGSPQSGVKINELRQQNRVGIIAAFPGDADNNTALMKRLGFEEADNIFVVPPGTADGARRHQILTYRSDKYSITTGSRVKDSAMKLLNYVYANEEGIRLKLCGFEGEDYSMMNGELVFFDKVKNDPDHNIISYLRLKGAFESFLDIQTGEFNLARAEKGYYAGLKEIERVGAGVSYPWIIPTPEESRELQSLKPDIDTYMNEEIMNFILGRTPLSEYDAYVEKLNSIGLERLIEIYQQQYDRYQTM